MTMMTYLTRIILKLKIVPLALFQLVIPTPAPNHFSSAEQASANATIYQLPTMGMRTLILLNHTTVPSTKHM